MATSGEGKRDDVVRRPGRTFALWLWGLAVVAVGGSVVAYLQGLFGNIGHWLLTSHRVYGLAILAMGILDLIGLVALAYLARPYRTIEEAACRPPLVLYPALVAAGQPGAVVSRVLPGRVAKEAKEAN